MDEDLQKVQDDCAFVREGLHRALGKSTAVEALLLLRLITIATELEREVGTLIDARQAGAKRK